MTALEYFGWKHSPNHLGVKLSFVERVLGEGINFCPIPIGVATGLQCSIYEIVSIYHQCILINE